MKKNRKIISEHVKDYTRVSEYGEVYTSAKEVNAMLDLVKHETERIDSRFLEPACGTGNFLTEVLNRKLKVVTERYSKNQIEFERYSFVAISSLYGIDILSDNLEICRKRLFDIFYLKYSALFNQKINDEFLNTIKFILFRNMIHGNALNLKTVGLTEEPIIFSEWSLVINSSVQRRDFKMKSLLENQKINEPNLFSDLGDEAFIPIPVKIYPLQNIYNLTEDVQYKL